MEEIEWTPEMEDELNDGKGEPDELQRPGDGLHPKPE